MDPIEWYRGLPPVTKTYVTGTTALAVSVYLGGYKTEQWLGLQPGSSFEIWRPFVSLFYTGGLDYSFISFLTFRAIIFGELETAYFNRTATFLKFFVCLSLVVFAFCYNWDNRYLGRVLQAALVYIWSRLTDNRLIFQGFFFDIPLWFFSYLPIPFALLGGYLNEVLADSSFLCELTGVFVGHLVFYVYFVLPFVCPQLMHAWRRVE